MIPVPVPSRSEEREIVEYLQRHALAVRDREELPEAGTEAAEVFTSACSRCHEVPDPAQHTPSEWPGVVDRMRGHLREMGLNDLSGAEARTIVDYLRRASDH